MPASIAERFSVLLKGKINIFEKFSNAAALKEPLKIQKKLIIMQSLLHTLLG